MKKSLWEIGMRVVRREIDKNRKKPYHISQELGVSPSTVTRWLKAERGVDKPNSRHLDAIFRTYNLSMHEVIMELLPEERSQVIIHILDNDLDLLVDFCEIIKAGDKKAKKLRSDVAFYKEDESED